MTAPLIFTIASLEPAFAPVPELAFVLQLAGLGAALGAAVALRAQRRWPSADTWRITTAWATLGLALGLLGATVGLLG